MEHPHRHNQDGTTDSICPHCFETIGTSTREADLERAETAHVCEPERLKYYQDALRRRPVRGGKLKQVESIKRVG